MLGGTYFALPHQVVAVLLSESKRERPSATGHDVRISEGTNKLNTRVQLRCTASTSTAAVPGGSRRLERRPQNETHDGKMYYVLFLSEARLFPAGYGLEYERIPSQA